LIRVQTRLLLLLVGLVGILLTGTALLYRSEAERAALLLQDQQRNKQDLLSKVVALKGSFVEMLDYDYSVWDEMVDFVKSADTNWARENIDVGLVTYRASAAWVCHTDLSPMYCASIIPGVPSPQLPFSAMLKDSLFRTGYFQHFFRPTPDGLMEIWSAPIQPSADAARQTPSQGFFIVGKLWTDDYVSELARLAGAQLSLEPISALSSSGSQPKSRETIVYSADSLYGWNGAPVAVLHCQSSSAFLNQFNRTVSRHSLLVIIFSAMLVFTLWYTLRLWVARPLSLISRALSEDDARPIEKLKMARNEFGLISYLIGQFFQQSGNLISEIVERKHTEEVLRETAAKVAALADEQRILLENARDFIYRHDPSGVFHYVSHSVEAVTGYTPQEWMQHYTVFLTDHPANSKVIDSTETAIREGVAFPPYQVEIFHKQGHRITLEVSEQPYFKGGKVAGIVGVARDITARIQAEEHREVLQRKLEKAERMESLGLLAGGVAHDLNNILGPLVAYPELIRMKLPPDSPHLRQLDIMGKAAKDAADVIQDLLALARRGRYDLQPTNLNDVLKQYLESSNYLSLQKANPSIRVKIALADEISCIMGSAPHLMKAIMNLIVNAFEAMANEGTLTISTSQEHLDRLRSDFSRITPRDYVVLSIKDTGVGIAAPNINKIFQPYYSSKQMGASGSGLGLAVVYGIVRDHKAYYDVFSEVGVGTEFLFYFPATTETVERQYEVPVNYSGVGKILVVDDVLEQREVAEQILSGMGFEVTTVTNGHEAIDYLRDQTADLVVLDMILEKDFDGLNTYAEIVKVRPGQKAIIVSGFAATERVAQMQELGAGPYIRKPYSRRDLAQAVQQQLGLEQQKSSSEKTTEKVPSAGLSAGI
jgi:two-component system, cell cycle sensor histidine kinase and response regulator CckA